MRWVLNCLGIEVGTELFALALEDHLVQVFYFGGLFHLLVVFFGLVECALLALLVGDAFAALERFVFACELLQVEVDACVLPAA
jgi:hypothetical protein